MTQKVLKQILNRWSLHNILNSDGSGNFDKPFIVCLKEARGGISWRNFYQVHFDIKCKTTYQ